METKTENHDDTPKQRNAATPIEPELLNEFDQYCEQEHRTRAGQLHKLITDYVETKRQEKAKQEEGYQT